ncbi:type II secretion system protein GspG [Lentisphaera profundi]|uniref:Type II secretion system protein GspG n=1 Tax=Lentisphaera profundi TaxID=1658616 RepID=A0ABY7VWN3_9BACT|nr:type II secretion system protein GspG [Lentisphaera profundi]WDE97679.1 type II secretion system protein GspG [Lentisphaera profundi]
MKKRYFSLIEIIIVVTIIALIAAFVAPKIIGKGDDAKVELTKAEMNNLLGVIEIFKLQTGQLPESLNELVENTRQLKGWKRQMDKAPEDSWKNPLIFERSSNNRHGFVIRSLGADSAPGGQDANADLVVPEE